MANKTIPEKIVLTIWSSWRAPLSLLRRLWMRRTRPLGTWDLHSRALDWTSNDIFIRDQMFFSKINSQCSRNPWQGAWAWDWTGPCQWQWRRTCQQLTCANTWLLSHTAEVFSVWPSMWLVDSHGKGWPHILLRGLGKQPWELLVQHHALDCLNQCSQ